MSTNEHGDPISLTRAELLRRSAAAGLLITTSGSLLAACGSDGDAQTASRGTTAAAKRGGVLRVGLAGGGVADTLDAHRPNNSPSVCRAINLYDSLGGVDSNSQYTLALAEEMTPNATADVWTLRLKEGLEFHNGKSITADDVIFTLMRLSDPKDPKNLAAFFKGVDRKRMKKLDGRTVRLVLTEPNAVLNEPLSHFAAGIVPADYDPKHPVGSGAFELESFKPGEQSQMTRFANYWDAGLPHVDRLTVLDINDDSARVNALVSGQVDAIDNVPAAQMPLIESSKGARTVISETGAWRPITMNCQAAPFDDVRVRQAMRLIAGRPQMVQQALSGQGRPASDLFSPDDPCFARDLVRQQDIEQARSLLKQAGQSDLTVELVTSPVAGGIVEASQVLAEQAKAAGVTIKVRQVDPGVLYGPEYTRWAFAVEYFPNNSYFFQVQASELPDSSLNVTQFKDPEFAALAKRGLATVDEKARCSIIRQMQQISFDRGGMLIWGFANNIDACSNKVSGLIPDSTGWSLRRYAFKHFSVS